LVALHDDGDGVASFHARAFSHGSVDDHFVAAVHRHEGSTESEAIDGAADRNAGAGAENFLDLEGRDQRGD
jgi:hypothetical protein